MQPDHEPNEIPKLPTWGQYRVPWFVTIWRGERPEFRIIDPKRWAEAYRERRCWICGGALRRRVGFAVGPMCTVNRVSAEPPQHVACAIYAAIHCPFLNDPERERRPLPEGTPRALDPGAILRNPGALAIWVCKRYQVFPGLGRTQLLRMGRPEMVLWYTRGRPATREEVQAAFEAGCPILERVAQQDGPEALAELERARDAARRYWPHPVAAKKGARS